MSDPACGAGYPLRVDLRVGATAVVVTVPAAQDLVGLVRAEFDPAAAIGVPPHVTLLYPWLDRAECTPADLDALAAICADVAAFDVSFTRFGRFPGVLWLAPDPAEPFVALTAAIARRWPQTPPYGGAHEVRPHLTVMDLDGAGVHHEDAAAMADVEARLAGGLPLRQRVGAVEVLEYDGSGVVPLGRMPLGRTPLARTPLSGTPTAGA